MAYRALVLEKRGGLAIITLNQPGRGNALLPPLSVELAEACREVAEDEGIRVVLLTGKGDFCGGGGGEEAHQAIEALARLEAPAIAAIFGQALGLGLALALACDLRIASSQARLGIPQLPSPLGGLTQRLPRLVGQSKALEMLLLGDTFIAEEAYRMGLVNQITSDPLQEAEAWAGRLLTKAPIPLRLAKEAVHKGLELTLGQGLRLEADLYFLLQTTQDRREGVTAFLEKRPPQFRGN